MMDKTLMDEQTPPEEETAEISQQKSPLPRVVVDAIPDLVFCKDVHGRYIECNSAFAEFAGKKRDEIIGRRDCEIFDEALAQIFGNCSREIETPDRPESDETWVSTASGRKVLLETLKTVCRDENGEILGLVGISRDCTRRKQTEETVRRSMKMAAVGHVVGGIAHDFNNILGIIIGNLDFIKHFGSPDDLILKRIEAAAKALDRAGMLTRQLLDFSRQQAGNCEPTDINTILRGLDSLIARSMTPEVEVTVDLAPDLWPVDIDRGDFEDVVLNLVINARDAMPDGGRLTLSTANIVLDEYYSLMHPGVDPGAYVLLAVHDDGVGMPDEVLEHIFEPYYTTKPKGKGTGLGMSMVYAFAQRVKGSIRVYSEQGVGTRVHLYLPKTQKMPQDKEQQTTVMPGLPGGNETILVVDDENDLLTLAGDMLKILGYTTLTCADGNQALNLLLDKENSIDLLFTDVVMPGGINGFELAQQALLLHPDLKILFTSGCAGKIAPKSGQLPFAPQILYKPYNEQDLAIRIREALEDA